MNLMDGYFVPRDKQPDADIDCTGTTGKKWEYVNPYPKMSLLQVGFTVTSATGAVSTAGVLTAYINRLDGTQDTLGTYTLVASTPALSSSDLDLDSGISNSQYIRDIENYPYLLRGESVEFNLTTQGSGGTQNVRPSILYREKEADTV